MTEVVNHKTYRGNEATVDIGRGSGLLGEGGWGNPYSHLASSAAHVQVADRQEAIEMYRELLWHLVCQGQPYDTELLAELASLDGHVLACWCKPKACHGDVLARASAWAARQLHGTCRDDRLGESQAMDVLADLDVED